MSNGFAYFIGIVAGALSVGLIWFAIQSGEPARTCESAALENRALEMCLKHRPTCEAVTTDDFIKFYRNRDWLDANCPADSGDGFLSQ